MKKTRFTESQIIKALQENEAGRKTEDICRELEEENARLKKMFADLSLNHEILKEVITKKGWGPGSKGS